MYPPNYPDPTNLLRRWQPLRPNLGSPLVFPTETGAVIDLSNFEHRNWRPMLKRLDLAGPKANPGCRKWKFRLLRHIYASQLIELGLNPKQVQLRLGHGSVTMTLDVYGHLWRNAEHEQQEVEAKMRLA